MIYVWLHWHNVGPSTYTDTLVWSLGWHYLYCKKNTGPAKIKRQIRTSSTAPDKQGGCTDQEENWRVVKRRIKSPGWSITSETDLSAVREHPDRTDVRWEGLLPFERRRRLLSIAAVAGNALSDAPAPSLRWRRMSRAEQIGNSIYHSFNHW